MIAKQMYRDLISRVNEAMDQAVLDYPLALQAKMSTSKCKSNRSHQSEVGNRSNAIEE